jgi:hypothetical protein
MHTTLTSKIKNKHESILPQVELLELRGDNMLKINLKVQA